MILRCLNGSVAALACCLLLPASPAVGQINIGPFTDFQTGTLESWGGGSSPTVVVDGGPLGSGDSYLRISATPGSLATFNTDLSGTLDAAVSGIQVDLLNDAGADPLDIRLVLFGPTTDDRWTSTIAQIVPGNGAWSTYTFSVLETDLTRVQGIGTYADLSASVERMMFRYDPDLPSPIGTFVTGSLGIDNVSVVGAPTLLGDYDGSGSVGTEDYALWKTNFGSNTDLAADGNGNGQVDAGDYTIWRDNLGSGVAAIPEPASCWLLALGFCLLRTRR